MPVNLSEHLLIIVHVDRHLFSTSALRQIAPRMLGIGHVHIRNNHSSIHRPSTVRTHISALRPGTSFDRVPSAG